MMVCATAIGGCARNPDRTQLGLRADTANLVDRHAPLHARRHTPPKQYSEIVRPRADPALLASLPAPDCDFDQLDIKAVDPDEWARLKLEYERQCYLKAEKIARDRLTSLQSSRACGVP